LSLAGVYCWTLLLVRRQWLAIWAAAMTALNGLLFVMSRTAMLDVFLVMFIVWALVAFTAALEVEAAPAARCVLMAVAGALLGLAMACKWIAAPVWALAVLLAMVGGWFGGRRSTEQPSTRKSGAYWGSSSRVAVLVMIAALVVIPVVVYLASFVPLLVRLHRPVSVASLVAEQAQAFRFHTQATGSPVNKSHFYDWPLALHPQWFFYEVAPNGLTVRAVILLGNPVVMWGGVVALVVCLARGLVRPRRAEWMVVLFYAAQLLSWAMIPRPIIYYYYYFPSAMMLGPAMAVALAGTPHGMGVRLSAILAGVAAVVFALMYPLMTAMWVPTWWNPWG
jgi:dolichyl-phosphate-mannose--protein O-mannosyl transferase